MDRRRFVQAAGLGLAGAAVSPGPIAASTGAGRLDVRVGLSPPFDPWLEIDAAALRANVARISRLTDGRPILAVVKNNAYGLGLAETAGVLEPLDAIAGFAVVKPSAALELRDAGIEKPVLLMGLAEGEQAEALVRRQVELSFYDEGAPERMTRLARRLQAPVRGHVYLDTGMGRMGIAYHRALPWLRILAATDAVEVAGTFMAFTEETEFDREQYLRFRTYADTVQNLGLPLGRLHAASSNGVYHLPYAHLDMVRPGIAIYGAYPSRPDEERAMQELTPAVRLCARVVRVEQLRTGDGVSYGRNYVATAPTWTATLPVGHTDGYPRSAVEGARVLIGDRLYPVIGAVSASHSIVEVGPEPTVAVGDRAVLMGSDHEALEPNRLAEATGASVYDLLMHLSPSLPRTVV